MGSNESREENDKETTKSKVNSAGDNERLSERNSIKREGEQPWDAEEEQCLPLNEYLPQLQAADATRKFQVYRCRRCGAKVADESDATSSPSGELQYVIFRRSRNVKLDGTCYRCGFD